MASLWFSSGGPRNSDTPVSESSTRGRPQQRASSSSSSSAFGGWGWFLLFCMLFSLNTVSSDYNEIITVHDNNVFVSIVPSSDSTIHFNSGNRTLVHHNAVVNDKFIVDSLEEDIPFSSNDDDGYLYLGSSEISLKDSPLNHTLLLSQTSSAYYRILHIAIKWLYYRRQISGSSNNSNVSSSSSPRVPVVIPADVPNTFSSLSLSSQWKTTIVRSINNFSPVTSINTDKRNSIWYSYASISSLPTVFSLSSTIPLYALYRWSKAITPSLTISTSSSFIGSSPYSSTILSTALSSTVYTLSSLVMTNIVTVEGSSGSSSDNNNRNNNNNNNFAEQYSFNHVFGEKINNEEELLTLIDKTASAAITSALAKRGKMDSKTASQYRLQKGYGKFLETLGLFQKLEDSSSESVLRSSVPDNSVQTMDNPAVLVRNELDRLVAEGIDLQADPILQLFDELSRNTPAYAYTNDPLHVPKESDSSSTVPGSNLEEMLANALLNEIILTKEPNNTGTVTETVPTEESMETYEFLQSLRRLGLYFENRVNHDGKNRKILPLLSDYKLPSLPSTDNEKTKTSQRTTNNENGIESNPNGGTNNPPVRRPALLHRNSPKRTESTGPSSSFTESTIIPTDEGIINASDSSNDNMVTVVKPQTIFLTILIAGAIVWYWRGHQPITKVVDTVENGTANKGKNKKSISSTVPVVPTNVNSTTSTIPRVTSNSQLSNALKGSNGTNPSVSSIPVIPSLAVKTGTANASSQPSSSNVSTPRSITNNNNAGGNSKLTNEATSIAAAAAKALQNVAKHQQAQLQSDHAVAVQAAQLHIQKQNQARANNANVSTSKKGSSQATTAETSTIIPSMIVSSSTGSMGNSTNPKLNGSHSNNNVTPSKSSQTKGIATTNLVPPKTIESLPESEESTQNNTSNNPSPISSEEPSQISEAGTGATSGHTPKRSHSIVGTEKLFETSNDRTFVSKNLSSLLDNGSSIPVTDKKVPDNLGDHSENGNDNFLGTDGNIGDMDLDGDGSGTGSTPITQQDTNGNNATGSNSKNRRRRVRNKGKNEQLLYPLPMLASQQQQQQQQQQQAVITTATSTVPGKSSGLSSASQSYTSRTSVSYNTSVSMNDPTNDSYSSRHSNFENNNAVTNNNNPSNMDLTMDDQSVINPNNLSDVDPYMEVATAMGVHRSVVEAMVTAMMQQALKQSTTGTVLSTADEASSGDMNNNTHNNLLNNGLFMDTLGKSTLSDTSLLPIAENNNPYHHRNSGTHRDSYVPLKQGTTNNALDFSSLQAALSHHIESIDGSGSIRNNFNGIGIDDTNSSNGEHTPSLNNNNNGRSRTASTSAGGGGGSGTQSGNRGSRYSSFTEGNNNNTNNYHSKGLHPSFSNNNNTNNGNNNYYRRSFGNANDPNNTANFNFLSDLLPSINLNPASTSGKMGSNDNINNNFIGTPSLSTTSSAPTPNNNNNPLFYSRESSSSATNTPIETMNLSSSSSSVSQNPYGTTSRTSSHTYSSQTNNSSSSNNNHYQQSINPQPNNRYPHRSNRSMYHRNNSNNSSSNTTNNGMNYFDETLTADSRAVASLMAARRRTLAVFYVRCIGERKLTLITEKLDESARLGDHPSLVALTLIAQGMDVGEALTMSGVVPARTPAALVAAANALDSVDMDNSASLMNAASGGYSEYESHLEQQRMNGNNNGIMMDTNDLNINNNMNLHAPTFVPVGGTSGVGGVTNTTIDNLWTSPLGLSGSSNSHIHGSNSLQSSSTLMNTSNSVVEDLLSRAFGTSSNGNGSNNGNGLSSTNTHVFDDRHTVGLTNTVHSTSSTSSSLLLSSPNNIALHSIALDDTFGTLHQQQSSHNNEPLSSNDSDDLLGLGSVPHRYLSDIIDE